MTLSTVMVAARQPGSVARCKNAISRHSRIAVAALLIGAAGTAQAQDVVPGDMSAGASKAYTCLGCHGVKHYVNTYPTYHVPRIAGQHAEYLTAALKAYRAQTRSHPTMQANAALLSDQDIADISAWFAAQGISN